MIIVMVGAGRREPLGTRFPGYQDESGMNSAARMALHRLASHIISTLLTCSDTAIRVAKAMIGAKAS